MTTRLTAEQAGMLIKIAHGVPVGDDRALLEPLESHAQLVWVWDWPNNMSRARLTERGRALLDAHLAEQGEDA